MEKVDNILGQRFNRFVVIGRDGIDKYRNATWLCRCDCGTEKVVGGYSLKSGNTKSCGCLKLEKIGYNFHKGGKRRGRSHPRWNGGKTIMSGYVYIHKPEHPNAKKRGYVSEHVLIMSNYLGRPLKENENVHHKNGIRIDNRIENLELWVRNHPVGQRVNDMVEFAKEILREYAPKELREEKNI